ncbi:hypothetical protein O3U67_05855 [Brevundimonas diminuta]|uniref:hypothetical protein n=1 Tax=Brevundimonas diminuta TaxID=293 RepID=UPI0022AEBA99|nr:hypothetical protein [Brevundimonas diminuta]MCZ4107593.1 hypothetical protein [Brevundimonas diminuta]
MDLILAFLLGFYLQAGLQSLRRPFRHIIKYPPLRAAVAVLWHLIIGPIWWFARLSRFRFLQPFALWAEGPIRWVVGEK